MNKPVQYQIRIEGHLDDTWADWFEGMKISNQDNGEAIISGYVPDQAALYGVLNHISELGLTLISVNVVPEETE